MDYRTFVPGPPLADFVDWFWHYEGFCPDHGKERVLPHGAMELVIDLQEGGYYDQPHFVHDFTAFSGLNPTRYLLAYDGTFNYIPIRD
jgi:hypothetical protein